MKEGREHEFGLRGGVELLINPLTGAFVADLLGKNIKFNLLTWHFLKLTLNFFCYFLDGQVPYFMQKKILAVNEYW